ncbi:hypothetical protein B5C34_14595 [Pacificimonas flava]|uniref:Uncharacterized protein n=1 Tax=Pacificimonas flava TaxID=1234595 RepID=A0A219B0A3_9SPHN|nr:hypothetical protein B5C34_14595 [Pacificimonas flava]
MLPFNGGTITLDCGLVSLKANDIIETFAGVVSDLASHLNAPQISQLTSVATSVASGVQDLLGAGDAETVLYLHDAFDASTLTSGHIFLSSLRQDEVEPSEVWMSRDGAVRKEERGPYKALRPQDYIVLRLEVTSERDDWRSISSIAKPLDMTLIYRAQGDAAKARSNLEQAIVAIFSSPELTDLDKKRIVEGIRKQLQNPLPGLIAAAEENRSADFLEIAAKSVSSSEAKAVAEATFSDVSNEMMRLI